MSSFKKQFHAKLDALRVAEMKIENAKKDRDQLVREIFPVGAHVQYTKHGQAVQTGIVERHGYDDVLWVTNLENGREIKIDGYHMHQSRRGQ